MAPSTGRKPRVALVGGGLGGLTAAIALTQLGIEAHVFEQTRELSEVGAGIGLTANVVKVLRDLGFESILRDRGFEPEARVGRNWSTAEQVFRVPLNGAAATTYGAPQIDIHRADLLEILAAAVPAAQVHLNSRCVAVSSLDQGAVITLSDGRQEEADLVVGCDGIRSRVRSVAHGLEAPRFTGYACWRALVSSERLPQGLATPDVTLWMGPGRHVVTYYVRSGELLNIVAVQRADEWTEESWTVAGRRDELISAYAGAHEELQALLDRVEQCFKWGLFDRDPLAVWSKQRITLLGDAAHPMLPFLGQGGAMAIEDAYILARAISRYPTDIPTALQAYEASRVPRATQVQIASRTRADRFHRDIPSASGLNVDWIYEYDPTGQLVA